MIRKARTVTSQTNIEKKKQTHYGDFFIASETVLNRNWICYDFRELRILVGTNLVRLSQLESVDLEIYKKVSEMKVINEKNSVFMILK